jgi:Uma2 family endonuclease
MSTAARLVTAEELQRLPANHQRQELVKGELRTMPPSGGEHGATVMEVSVPLATHVKQHGLGLTFGAETGFLLARDPDTVRAPDLAFVSRARIPSSGVPPSGFWPGAPDLAVEVLSPNDTAVEVEDKVSEWLEAGTRMVWVVNPRRRTVTVYRTPRGGTILGADDELDGQEVVPGFRCRVASLFLTPSS